MDAIFFKFLIEELFHFLKGIYIKKVYHPSPEVWIFHFSSKKNLFFIFGRQKALFLSDFKTNISSPPSADVMYFRKHIQGGKVSSVVTNWVFRKFGIKVTKSNKNVWILFDFKEGVVLDDRCPIEPAKEVGWPDIDLIREGKNIFKTYPYVTPLLRKEIAQRSLEDARKLLFNIKNNIKGKFYLYYLDSGPIVSSWNIKKYEENKTVKVDDFSSALECANKYGWLILEKIKDDEKRSIEREIKRLRKILVKLHEDEDRLRKMVDRKKDALLIQQNLYRFDPQKKYPFIEIDSQTIKLDPTVSLLKNMERMFKLAKKGERGLKKIEDRRNEILTKLEDFEKNKDIFAIEKKLKRINLTKSAGNKKECLDIKFQMYKTNDGFVVIRGKDQRSNHLLLSNMASPFDLWFHVEDGPGAHVILKRDHPTQDVPSTSLIQAAQIAAVFSYQRYSNKASVICALVKDVRKIKGAGLGRMRIMNVFKNLLVEVDIGLEERLRV